MDVGPIAAEVIDGREVRIESAFGSRSGGADLWRDVGVVLHLRSSRERLQPGRQFCLASPERRESCRVPLRAELALIRVGLHVLREAEVRRHEPVARNRSIGVVGAEESGRGIVEVLVAGGSLAKGLCIGALAERVGKVREREVVLIVFAGERDGRAIAGLHIAVLEIATDTFAASSASFSRRQSASGWVVRADAVRDERRVAQPLEGVHRAGTRRSNTGGIGKDHVGRSPPSSRSVRCEGPLREAVADRGHDIERLRDVEGEIRRDQIVRAARASDRRPSQRCR